MLNYFQKGDCAMQRKNRPSLNLQKKQTFYETIQNQYKASLYQKRSAAFGITALGTSMIGAAIIANGRYWMGIIAIAICLYLVYKAAKYWFAAMKLLQ
jgi:hypothetical protein